ncbi:MAG: hypothetical protein JRI68_34215 [Deltaproteobacteria bacterium]|nr:hypothetical protein [Deltaproteobacteria bacterium]
MKRWWNPKTRRGSVLAAAVAALLTAGCPGTAGVDPVPAPPDNPLGDKCEGGKASNEPDLMGWQAGQRAILSMLRAKGVVAVRYQAQGCDVELEVLPNCIGEGSYEFSPYVANESKLARNVAELRAKLPIGAAELGGHLKDGWSLRTDYRLAGMVSLPVGQRYSRDDLVGLDCDRATHVVARIYLGGFAIMAGESTSIAAEATIFGAGFSAGHLTEAESLASEGDAAGCLDAQKEARESALCAVPLRLGLLPLGSPYDHQAAAGDPVTGSVPLAVIDEHGCNQDTQVWDGTRCVSVKEKEVECPKGQYPDWNTKECVPCQKNVLTRGCP